MNDSVVARLKKEQIESIITTNIKKYIIKKNEHLLIEERGVFRRPTFSTIVERNYVRSL